MARISQLEENGGSRNGRPSKNGTKKKRTTTGPPPPISFLIYIIPLISIAVGVYVHSNAHRPALKKELGPHMHFFSPFDEDADTPLEQRYNSTLPPLHRLLYTLNTFFVDLLSSQFGRGSFVTIMSVALTPFLAMLLEGIRHGQSRLLGAWLVILFASFGQVVLIGAITPIIYVPIFAYVSWKQATNEPQVIRPLPSPPSWQVNFVTALTLISGLPFVWCMLVPLDSPRHLWWATTAFQFFPFIWLPILLLRPIAQGQSSSQPRLSAARAYSFFAYLSVPLWWYGLYLSGPTLWRIWRESLPWPSQAARMIFVDTMGLCFSFYAIVLLQAEVDLRGVQCGGPRVHRARLFIEDFLFGTTGLLIMGPGFAMGTYHARREVLAEKARFGIAPAFAQSMDTKTE